MTFPNKLPIYVVCLIILLLIGCSQANFIVNKFEKIEIEDEYKGLNFSLNQSDFEEEQYILFLIFKSKAEVDRGFISINDKLQRLNSVETTLFDSNNNVMNEDNLGKYDGVSLKKIVIVLSNEQYELTCELNVEVDSTGPGDVFKGNISITDKQTNKIQKLPIFGEPGRS